MSDGRTVIVKTKQRLEIVKQKVSDVKFAEFTPNNVTAVLPFSESL